MSRLTDAISWSGRDVTLSLFIAYRTVAPAEVSPPVDVPQPQLIRQYDLEDIDRHLPGRSCREYDLIYDEVPQDLELVVGSWVAAAMSAGAEFAWFGFEGSFDFEHILTTDVVDQLFAVGTPEETQIALDDGYREGPAWAALVASLRGRLGL